MKKTPGMKLSIMFALILSGLVMQSCEQPGSGITLDPPPEQRVYQTIEIDGGIPEVTGAAITSQGFNRDDINGVRIKNANPITIDITTGGVLDTTKIDQASSDVDDLITAIDDNQYLDGVSTFSFDIYTTSKALLDLKLSIEEASITATSAELTDLDTAVANLLGKLSTYADNSMTEKTIGLDQSVVDSKVVEDVEPEVTGTVHDVTGSTLTEIASNIDALILAADDGFKISIPSSLTTAIDLASATYAGDSTHPTAGEFYAIYQEMVDNADSVLNKAIGKGKPFSLLTDAGTTLDFTFDLSGLSSLSADVIENGTDGIKDDLKGIKTLFENAFSGAANATVNLNVENIDTLGFDLELNPLQDNAGAGLTIANINTLLADASINIGNLFIKNPGPITGTWTTADIDTLKIVCFDNAGLHGESAPAFVNTDSMYWTAGAATQATVEDLFNSHLAADKMTELHLANGSWTGEFRVSPSSATGAPAATLDLDENVFLDGPSFNISNLTLKLNNDAVAANDLFNNTFNDGEFANILLNNLDLDSSNSSDASSVTIDINSKTDGSGSSLAVTENIMNANYLNTNGSAKSLQLSDMNWNSSLALNIVGDSTYEKVSSAVLNDLLSMLNTMFTATAMKDVMVTDNGTLSITSDKSGVTEKFTNVLFDCPVNSDLSNAQIEGDTVFNKGVAGSDFSNVLFINGANQVVIINGSVAGANVSGLSLQGVLDLKNASGQMTGTVTNVDNLRAPNAESTYFANTTSVATAADNETYNGGKTRTSVLAAFNSTFGTALTMADIEENETLMPTMIKMLNNGK